MTATFHRVGIVFSNMSNIRQQRKNRTTTKNAVRIIETPQGAVPDIEDAVSLFSEDETQRLRVALLEWYDNNRRDLPWRTSEEKEEESVDSRAYAVWVSEVMLQQTRVQTVIAYYNRWMEKWPTINHLAQAALEEVNEMWAGLGYYRRARFLLEGANKIVKEGGNFPKTVSTLRQIPGIGEYTAGAIASIAFQEAVPVVDGNVIRAIARLKAVSTNPKDSVTIKRFWKLAAQLVDPLRPGDFNQALMELGSTLCTPSNPGCSSCPVSEFCSALSLSKQDSSVSVTDYPVKVIKAKQRHDFSAVCVVELLGSERMLDGNLSSSEFILVKRPDEGLLAGLWEFPSVSLDGETDSLDRRKATDQFLKSILKIDIKKSCNIVLREDLGEFVHIFSHIRLKLYVELLVLQMKGRNDDLFKSQGRKTTACKCVNSNALSSMGLTSSVRKTTSKLAISSRNKITCSAVQESSTTTAATAETKEVNAAPKAEEAAKKPPAKAPAKPLPQMMEEDVIPSLKAILEAQQDLSDIELLFQDNKLEGSFLKQGNPYSFWAFFPDGVLTGPKGFSLSSYNSKASTVEPFLIDEKKITAKHVIFWVEKRLAAQGLIPVWKD
ncbi:adenine DNA glycosylase-like [Senna tora]|uniref:Adenine DNA glycosylase n=1 Tax=Senna tora TaxID=362788 RepID=A0A834XIW3_9FABA|nr:adenine DNA glycosylase-like [Senna tora]